MRAQKPGADSAETGRLSRWLPFSAAAATLAIVAAASFLPEKRLWGINHLAFYPVPVRLAALTLAAAAFVPRVAGGICSALTGSVEYFRRRRAVGRVTALTAAIISLGAFWLLQSSTLLLGDSRLVASNFRLAFDPGYKVLVSSPRFILLQENLAKGTALLYHYAARISLEAFGASPVDGIRFLNCALGGVFVFILLRTVLKRPSATILAVWTILIILTSGVMELFFGYVENYTPLIFFGSLYVALSVDYLRSGKGSHLFPVLACLVLAVFMHVQGILLVPSFVFLLALHYSEYGKLRPWRLTAALTVLTAVGTLVFALITEYSRHFLPGLADEEIFGILSPSHLADIANEIMLILPTAIVATAIALAYMRGPSGGTVGTEDRPRRVRLQFILVVLFPCLLFLFVFKPDLGMARDWDLFAMTALGLLPLCLIVLSIAHGGGARRQVESITGPAAALCLMLLAAWVGVNASPGRSAKRFEAILEYDQTRAPYAYEVLAQHYRHSGDMDRAIATLQKGMSKSYNLRLVSLSAAFHDEMGEGDEAVRLYKEVVENQPERDGPRRNLVILLHKLRRRDELLEFSRDGTRYHPEKPVYHYFYGLMLIDSGKIEHGIDELLTCRRLRPGPDVIADVDAVLRRLEARGYDVEESDSPTEFRVPAEK